MKINTKISKKIFLNFFAAFLFLFIIIYSIGKSSQYFFYTDDFALLYRIQQRSPYAWPYHYLIQFFSPFYQIFGLQPNGYFILSIASLFFVCLVQYIFMYELTKSRFISFFSTCITATGLFGLDQYILMSVSTINNISTMFILLCLFCYIRFIRTSRLLFYVICLFLYAISIHFFPFRTFIIFMFLPTIAVYFAIQKISSIRDIFLKGLSIVFRYIPFIGIAYWGGIFSYGSGMTYARIFDLFSQKEHQMEFLAIFGRMIFIDPIKYFFLKDSVFNNYSSVGIISILFITFLFLSLWLQKRNNKFLLLPLTLVLTLEGYFGNFILIPQFDSTGPYNRYLFTSGIALSVCIPTLFFLIYSFFEKPIIKRIVTLFFCILSIGYIYVLSDTSRLVIEKHIQVHSLPAEEFVNELKYFLPKLSGNAIIQLDRTDRYPYADNFGRIILGALMPREVVLASLYQVPIESIRIVDTVEELLELKSLNPEWNVHAFYYDEKGLQQTTELIFNNNPIKKNVTIVPKESNNKDISSPIITIDTDSILSFYPFSLNFSLQVSTIPLSSLTFPYFQNENILTDKQKQEIQKYYSLHEGQKEDVFKYLTSKHILQKIVTIQSDSSHHLYPITNAVDKDTSTWWLAKTTDWEVKKTPHIILDLNSMRNISQLNITTFPGRIFSNYKIYTSQDGQSWIDVSAKIQTSFYQDQNILLEIIINPTFCRFIQIDIQDTISHGEPGIKELEVVESQYSDVDEQFALRVEQNPTEYFENLEDSQITYAYLNNNSMLLIQTKTDKDLSYDNIYEEYYDVNPDGSYHSYQTIIPPRGVRLEGIRFSLPYSAFMKIENISIQKL